MKIIEKIHQKRTTKKFIKSSLQSSTWQHYQAKKIQDYSKEWKYWKKA